MCKSTRENDEKQTLSLQHPLCFWVQVSKVLVFGNDCGFRSRILGTVAPLAIGGGVNLKVRGLTGT